MKKVRSVFILFWFLPILAYSSLVETWITSAAMPTARWGFATGVTSGKLYAVGGYGGFDLLGRMGVCDPMADDGKFQKEIENTGDTIVGTVENIVWNFNSSSWGSSFIFYLILNEHPGKYIYFNPKDWEKYGLIKFEGPRELGLIGPSIDENSWKGIKVKIVCSKINDKSKYPEKVYIDNAYYIENLEKE